MVSTVAAQEPRRQDTGSALGGSLTAQVEVQLHLECYVHVPSVMTLSLSLYCLELVTDFSWTGFPLCNRDCGAHPAELSKVFRDHQYSTFTHAQ